MAATETFALLGSLASAFALSFALARRRCAGPVWYFGACAGVALLLSLLLALYPRAWFLGPQLGGGAVLLLLAGAAVIGKGAADGFNKGD